MNLFKINNISMYSSLALTATAALFIATSCGKPPEREAKVSAKIEKNLIAIKDIEDMSNVKREREKPLQQNESLQKIIKQIKDETTSKAVSEALLSNNLEFLIFKDRIVFFRKVTAADYDKADFTNKNIYSDRYLLKCKQLEKTEDLAGQQVLREELDSKLIYIRPAHQGYVIIAAVKATIGVLENEKTDYNEKKSTLVVNERGLEFATHLVIGEETTEPEQVVQQTLQVVSE